MAVAFGQSTTRANNFVIGSTVIAGDNWYGLLDGRGFFQRSHQRETQMGTCDRGEEDEERNTHTYAKRTRAHASCTIGIDRVTVTHVPEIGIGRLALHRERKKEKKIKWLGMKLIESPSASCIANSKCLFDSVHAR